VPFQRIKYEREGAKARSFWEMIRALGQPPGFSPRTVMTPTPFAITTIRRLKPGGCQGLEETNARKNSLAAIAGSG